MKDELNDAWNKVEAVAAEVKQNYDVGEERTDSLLMQLASHPATLIIVGAFAGGLLAFFLVAC